MPTAAERQGDFSELLRRFPDDPNVILYNPFTTRIDEDGNSIREPGPQQRSANDGHDRSASAGVGQRTFSVPSGYVNPANPDDLRNHRISGTRGNFNWRYDTRFDYRASDSDNIYVGYSRSKGKDSNTGGLFPELPENVVDTSYIVTLSYAHVMLPRR